MQLTIGCSVAHENRVLELNDQAGVSCSRVTFQADVLNPELLLSSGIRLFFYL